MKFFLFKIEKSEPVEVVKTEGGDQPQKLADDILMAVLSDADEHIKFSFQFSHWLRVTCPPFFHLMMSERAKKMISDPNFQQRF